MFGIFDVVYYFFDWSDWDFTVRLVAWLLLLAWSVTAFVLGLTRKRNDSVVFGAVAATMAVVAWVADSSLLAAGAIAMAVIGFIEALEKREDNAQTGTESAPVSPQVTSVAPGELPKPDSIEKGFVIGLIVFGMVTVVGLILIGWLFIGLFSEIIRAIAQAG